MRRIRSPTSSTVTMSSERPKSSFEIASISLFGLMMTANVVNYIYQVVMGNVLSVTDFGALNAIQAFITIAGIPAGAFLMIASRATAQESIRKNRGKLSATLSPIISMSVFFGLAMTVLCLALSMSIASWLQLDNTSVVAIATLFVGFNCVFNSLCGILQGGDQLNHYGGAQVASMLSKLAFSLFFVIAGLNLIGAMAGIVIAPVFAGLYCAICIARHLPFSFTFTGISKTLSLLKPLRNLLILQVVLAVFTNGDILLVKALFSPEVAGAYSSGMVLGKIPLFASSALVGVLFPFVAASSTNGGNTLRLLWKAIGYGSIIAIACSLALCIFGKPLIDLFFGERYTSSIGYLPAVSALALSLTLVTIVANFAAASNRMGFFNASGAIGVAVSAGFITIWHPNATSVILVLACIIAIIAIANLIHIMLQARSSDQTWPKRRRPL